MKRKYLITLLLCLSVFSIKGEEQKCLADVLLKDCPDGYMGQRADNSKAKNGTGILKVSGGIYIGDISRNQFSGKGMLICDNKAKISNSPDAFVYIGGWLKGKKQGRGRCYDTNGDLIYDGLFENDKPKDTYPTPDADIHRYYSMMEMSDGYYIGEIVDGSPDGFGLYAHENDGIWIGATKDGFRHGRGILIFSPTDWAVANFKNGNFSISATSDLQVERNNTIKQINSQMKSEFWSGMAEVATGLVGVAADFTAQKNASSQKNYASNSEIYEGVMSETMPSDETRDPGIGTNKSSNSGTSTKNVKKGTDCGTYWKSDSITYGWHDDNLVMYGDQWTADEIRQTKKNMREIRLKWEKRGCPITKSPRED